MKTVNNLYPEICSFDNVYRAYLKARKGKRYKKEVLAFTRNLEENLLVIHNELMHGAYCPGAYRSFIVYEPKERLILALPFKDRVVHHALCSVISPVFEKTFIKDSYACREGKGTIRGIERLEEFLTRLSRRHKEVYCLKMDIRKYFYSIDHDVLKILIRRKIRCKRTLGLIDKIIDSTPSPGIAIGNLTSQLFANIYLGSLDHFIKETLGIKCYVRYMDDMLILHQDKKELWRYLEEIRCRLKDMRLELNNKTSVFNVKRGIDFLGYRQFMNTRILRKRVLKKSMRKFSMYQRTGVEDKKMRDSLASFMGLCRHSESRKNIEAIKNLIGEKKWEQMSLK